MLNQVASKVPKATLINALNMAAVSDVLRQVAPKVPLAKLINAKNMAAVSDVLNLDA